MHRYHLSIFMAACLVMLAGCQTPQSVKNAWKGTKVYYTTYLNTPAALDMEDKGRNEDYEVALGTAISDFDLQLQELERVLQNSDRNPDPAWVNSMSRRFPWLAGLILTDHEGVAQAKVPLDYPKHFEIGTLAQEDPKQKRKDLRAFVQMHPLGPELYIGNPVYMGDEFRGVIIAHFDPRTLIARTTDPTQIMIASPEGIIWPGIFAAETTPIAQVDWAEKVKSESYGTVSNENGTFFWMTRYIGNLPLVYAIKVEGTFPKNPDNLAALSVANSYGLGGMGLANDGIQIMQAQPPQGNGSGLVEGEVGDIGSPNVSPDAPPSGPVVPQRPSPKESQLDQ